jgi:putative tricarboxylic transport membrane protein
MGLRRPGQIAKGVAVAAVLVAATAACSGTGAAAGGGGSTAAPSNIQFVVDTGPGGGSDLFARQIVKLAQQDKLITGNWPVNSQPQGGGLGAMAFMKGKNAQPNFVSAFTSKWVISGLSTNNPPATLADLTPIAELAEEQQMIAVPANSPYNSFTDFLNDAKAKPGRLVQVGGANTSVDNLVALKFQKDAGTTWKYLSFADGGPRITALLRGDAQIMIGAQTDFSEQVAAKQLKIIGVIGDKRASAYPDVPTLKEQGVPTDGLPSQLQFRGIAGPPGMPADAVKYYQDMLSKLVKTPEWQKYMDSEGDVTAFVTGDDLNKLVTDFTTTMRPLVALLPQGSQ